MDYIFLSGEREVGGTTEKFKGKDRSTDKYILRWEADRGYGNDMKLKTDDLYILVA